MEESTAVVTVSAAVPVFPETGSVAVIVIRALVAFDVATPLLPAALLMVATATLEELQVTADVRSRLVKSE